MRVADRLTGVERAVSRALEWLVAMLFLGIFGLVVTLVGLRYLFNSSITGANELVTILFVYTTAIGAALAVGRREHVAILFAVERLPRRLQRPADALTLVAVALVNAVLVVKSVQWIGATGDFLMPSIGLPRVWAQLSVPFGCGLAIIYSILRLIRPQPSVESSGVESPGAQEDQGG